MPHDGLGLGVAIGDLVQEFHGGADWHLSYTHRGKGHTQYIREAFVLQVKAVVSNFKRFKKFIDRLITLSIERSQLRMKTDKKQ